jgi:hypothetical protein
MQFISNKQQLDLANVLTERQTTTQQLDSANVLTEQQTTAGLSYWAY